MLQFCKLLDNSILPWAPVPSTGHVVHQDHVDIKIMCRVALFHLEEYETAKAAFEAGQALDPNNSSFKTWIRKCAAEIEGTHWQAERQQLDGHHCRAVSCKCTPISCIPHAM